MKHTIAAALNAAKLDPNEDPFPRPTGSWIESASEPNVRLDGAGAFVMLARLNAINAFTEVTASFKEIGAGFGECRYFTATIPDRYRGYEAVVPYGELNPSQKRATNVAPASKPYTPGIGGGIELVCSDIEAVECFILHIAIGHKSDPFRVFTENDCQLYTWFPGRPAHNVDLFKVFSDALFHGAINIPHETPVKLGGAKETQ